MKAARSLLVAVAAISLTLAEGCASCGVRNGHGSGPHGTGAPDDAASLLRALSRAEISEAELWLGHPGRPMRIRLVFPGEGVHRLEALVKGASEALPYSPSRRGAMCFSGHFAQLKLHDRQNTDWDIYLTELGFSFRDCPVEGFLFRNEELGEFLYEQADRNLQTLCEGTIPMIRRMMPTLALPADQPPRSNQ